MSDLYAFCTVERIVQCRESRATPPLWPLAALKMAERLNGILKGEYFLDRHFKTKIEARKAVKEAIWIFPIFVKNPPQASHCVRFIV